MMTFLTPSSKVIVIEDKRTSEGRRLLILTAATHSAWSTGRDPAQGSCQESGRLQKCQPRCKAGLRGQDVFVSATERFAHRDSLAPELTEKEAKYKNYKDVRKPSALKGPGPSVAVFCAQQHNNNNYHELSFALLKLSDQTSVHRKVWDSVISPAKGAAMDTLLMSRTRR